MIQKVLLTFLALTLLHLFSPAQRIFYSEPEKDDVRSIDFDIIGKLNNQYLVYKQVRNSHAISVYDNSMKLLERVNMDFLPDKLINSDIIAYKDFFYFVYQYQKKNVIRCMAARIDANGKIMGDPIVLDTTAISFFASNKVYNVLYSEDKQRIAVYKLNNKGDQQYVFSCSLFDDSLAHLSSYTAFIPMEQHNDFLTEFSLANDGTIVFVKASGNSQNSNLENLALMVKEPEAERIFSYPLDIGNIFLDNIRVKVDNKRNHFVVSAFYSKQKRGNIDGLYCAVWDETDTSLIAAKQVPFNDELKSNAKSEGSSRSAFNDYFLQNIFVRKDGGFAIAAESAYTSSRGVYNSRWDYMYNSPYWYNSNSYLYGSPYSYYYPWTSPYGYGSQSTRYYADNIAVIAFDSTATMEWASIIPKSQYDDNSDNFIGYGIYIGAGQVNFLFNQFERRTLLLQAESIDPNGKAVLAPTLKELDRGYQFMPRYAKQVSSHEVLLPCQYRSYLCFAKIDF
ncbi:MAG TPA: hypothetical protein VEV83_09380 [Parafilimonas sp.]|nr:hypothetical protein [Parafilimonas sp.]